MGQIHYLHPTRMRTEYQSPISAMNTTPLIDVLLVLLVMLIITLPASMHKIDVPLAQKSDPATPHEPTIQKLVLTVDGVAHWNGIAVGDAALGDHLRSAAVSGDDLQIQTDGGTRYERFNHLIALVRKSGVTRIGFAGNAQFSNWGR